MPHWASHLKRGVVEVSIRQLKHLNIAGQAGDAGSGPSCTLCAPAPWPCTARRGAASGRRAATNRIM